MDMLRQLGIDKDFCQANDYSSILRDMVRKNGKNRKDLLKDNSLCCFINE